MNENEQDKILAFDTLFTNNRIQMYKILLSYLQPSAQKHFAIYIKLMELQYTISFFQNHPLAALNRLSSEIPANSGSIVDELLPFCDMAQRNQLNQMKSMLQSFENMQEMLETLQMLRELFPEGTDNRDTSGGKMAEGCMDISQLLGMLGGIDMSALSDMFPIFHDNTDKGKEKEDND